MPSKSYLVAGIVAGILLIVLLFFLFQPQIHSRIGLYQYGKAGKIEKKMFALYMEMPNEDSDGAPAESQKFWRRQKRLRLKTIECYERAVDALSRSREMKVSALDDRALVALANSRIGALGKIYPPRHTISEIRHTLELARAELEEAIRINENNKNAYSSLIQANLNFLQRNPEEAVEACERFKQAFPKDAAMYSDCGCAYAAAGETDSARAHFAKAIELEPASTASLLLYPILMAEGKAEDARSLLTQYIENAPSPTGVWSAKDMLRREEKAWKLEEDIREKLKENPDDFEAVREMAEVLSKSGRFDLAYEWHQKAHEMRPDDGWALRRLASLQLWRDPEAAVKSYKKLLWQEDDESSKGYDMENLGFAYYMMGDYDKALSWYKKAEAASDYYSMLLFRMAECYDKMGNEEMAEEYGRKHIDYSKKVDDEYRHRTTSIRVVIDRAKSYIITFLDFFL